MQVSVTRKKTEQGGLPHGLYLTVADWTLWWSAMAANAIVVSLSFNAYFPTLSATLGYDPTVSLLPLRMSLVINIIAFWLCR